MGLSTYRLQFNADFTFRRAAEIVGYLHALGVDAIYSSPELKARPGSPHGYDVVDPTRFNPEIGGARDFSEFRAARAAVGMGLVVDIVPNHMAATYDNPWWRDVLEHGSASRYAGFFDVDWEALAPHAGRAGRLLIPVLGEPYAAALAGGALSLDATPDGLIVRYYDGRFPLDPASYVMVFDALVARSPGKALVARLARWRAIAQKIPPRDAPGQRARGLRAKLTHVLKEEMKAFVGDDLRNALASVFGAAGGSASGAASGDASGAASGSRFGDARWVREPARALLHRVLSAQVYRLGHWRLASERLNYRRFFDVSDLVALNVVRPEVFAERHRGLLAHIARGDVTGLRIDHIDGLTNPGRYLEMLHAAIAGQKATARRGAAPFYVVVEKILAPDEALHPGWRCDGTTGYEFARVLGALFVDPRGFEKLREIYARATGGDEPFADIFYRCQKQAIAELFLAELRRLSRRLADLAADDVRGCDISQTALERALLEVTACLPVYRTYVQDTGVRAEDLRVLRRAFADARARAPACDPAAFDFLERVLTLRLEPGQDPSERLRFIVRWQQWSGAVMAKGLEDTAFYVYNVLTSLNEVGGDASGAEIADAPARFHAHNARMQRRWPRTMLATSTHDTKRSEDVRARISTLAERPLEWATHLTRWRAMNARHKRAPQWWPDANTEILLYQTMIGAWPLDAGEVPGFRERLKQYLLKAMREQKQITRWTNPDVAYEAAVLRFVDAIFRGVTSSARSAFGRDFLAWQRRVARDAAVTSLAQVVLKCAAPGVPDIYQGCEMWDLSLVDPDNRRPVDYDRRQRALAEIDAGLAKNPRALLRELTRGWQDGRIKLLVTAQALRARRAHREIFAQGTYRPLTARGGRNRGAAAAVVAFARRRGAGWVIAIAPCRAHGLGGYGRCFGARNAFSGVSLVLGPRAPTRWRHALTGEIVDARDGRLDVGAVFRSLPVGLLVGE